MVSLSLESINNQCLKLSKCFDPLQERGIKRMVTKLFLVEKNTDYFRLIPKACSKSWFTFNQNYVCGEANDILDPLHLNKVTPQLFAECVSSLRKRLGLPNE